MPKQWLWATCTLGLTACTPNTCTLNVFDISNTYENHTAVYAAGKNGVLHLIVGPRRYAKDQRRHLAYSTNFWFRHLGGKFACAWQF